MRSNGRNKSDEHLPKLGLEPYIELINETSATTTNTEDAKLGLMLLWLSDYTLDAIDEELATFDITESKMDLLILLSLHQERRATPSAIATRLGVARASVTSMIDWLEKRNLVVRSHGLEDRRKVYVSLTKEGYEFVKKVLPTYWSFCASSVVDLEEDERQLLGKLMAKITTTMQKKLGVER